MSVLLFAMAAFIMNAIAVGQSQPPQAESAPYRTGTRVVEITISATRSGQSPVDDLKAGDLRLFDNGKEQTIASFEKVGEAKGPVDHHRQRLYVIVLDSLNTPWSEAIYGRDGVCGMLSKLPPGDRIAIFGLDGNLRLLHDFSTDYESLRAAVDHYSGPRPPYEEFGWVPYPERTGKAFDASTYPFYSYPPYDQSYPLDSTPPMYTKYPVDREDPLAMNQAVAYATPYGISPPEGYDIHADAPFDAYRTTALADSEETNQILYTLQALTRIAQLTKGYPGPKSILWVSAGFPTQFETYLDGAAIPEFFHIQTALAMRELQIDNAVLDPISPEGLDWSHIDSMKEMADQTGGRVYYDSNDVSGLVRAARDDMQQGYVLTFVPKDYDADGSLHQIRIQTSRPGVELRYRTIYGAAFQTPTIAEIASASGGGILPNTWVEIKGTNLAPTGDSRTWRLSDVVNNQLPTQLDGVVVTMNGENAYIYSISPGQVRVLTPPDLAPGPVKVQVSTGGVASASFIAQAR